MVKSLISKTKRIVFKNKGDQINFLINSKESLKLNWKELSDLLNIQSRTLFDWRKEKFNMSYDSAKFLSKKAGIKISANTKVQDWGKHLKDASRKGGLTTYQKYGKICKDEEKRKKAWEKWWKETGQFKEQKIFQTKSVKIPDYTEDLAEFVGIMIGDGGVTKYHITITLNSERDVDYIKYVNNLVKKLFGVTPKIYKIKNELTKNIVVHRKNLVSFCNSIGLKIGNKLQQNLDIPGWIKNNKKYQKKCIRGLVDTDGSFYIHSYTVGGKEYKYLKIDFTSNSKKLLGSVLKILETFGINANINYNGRSIRIENQSDVKKYIEIIGSSNLKNQKLWRDG